MIIVLLTGFEFGLVNILSIITPFLLYLYEYFGKFVKDISIVNSNVDINDICSKLRSL